MVTNIIVIGLTIALIYIAYKVVLGNYNEE